MFCELVSLRKCTLNRNFRTSKYTLFHPNLKLYTSMFLLLCFLTNLSIFFFIFQNHKNPSSYNVIVLLCTWLISNHEHLIMPAVGTVFPQNCYCNLIKFSMMLHIVSYNVWWWSKFYYKCHSTWLEHKISENSNWKAFNLFSLDVFLTKINRTNIWWLLLDEILNNVI